MVSFYVTLVHFNIFLVLVCSQTRLKDEEGFDDYYELVGDNVIQHEQIQIILPDVTGFPFNPYEVRNDTDLYNDHEDDLIIGLKFGFTVENTTRYQEEQAIIKGTICDIEKISRGETRSYLPSLCVEPNDCEVEKGSEVVQKSRVCPTKTCCRVDYITSLNKITFSPYFEIPEAFTIPPQISIIGQYHFLPENAEIPEKLIWDVDNVDLQQMNTYRLCAIDRVSPDNHLFNLYFCVPTAECPSPGPLYQDGHDTFSGSPLPNTTRDWNDICDNLGQPGKLDCCYSGFIKDQFKSKTKDVGDIDIFKSVPMVPLFIKYAPGFRASYMCEHYSRMLCTRKQHCRDTCPNNQDLSDLWYKDYFHAPEGIAVRNEHGDFPHQALLGVYSPNFLFFFYCNGALVSRRWVLSTKRCSTYRGLKPNLIMLGMHNIDGDLKDVNVYEELYLISKILTYPFNEEEPSTSETDKSILFDYGLYQTHTDVHISAFVKPACIYHNKNPPNWEQLFFTGYSASQQDFGEGFEAPSFKRTTLQKIQMKRIFAKGHSKQTEAQWKSACSAGKHYGPRDGDSYYSIFGVKQDHQMCAIHGSRPVAPCQYDEGGPLQFKLSLPGCLFQIFAVTSSRREKCVTTAEEAESQVTAFQLVAPILEKLEDILWKYPFLEDIKRPVMTPENLFDLHWYDRCNITECMPDENESPDTAPLQGDKPEPLIDDYSIELVKFLDGGLDITSNGIFSIHTTDGNTAYLQVPQLDTKFPVCDIWRVGGETGSKSRWSYSPSFCVDTSDLLCLKNDTDNPDDRHKCPGKGLNNIKVCCPFTQTWTYARSHPEIFYISGYNWRELTTSREPLAYNYDVAYNNSAWLTYGTEREKDLTTEIKELVYDERFKEYVEKMYVCGIKTIFHKGYHQYTHTPFFCVEPNRCRSPPSFSPPWREWHEQCHNHHFLGQSESLEGKTVCCHPQDFLDDYFSNLFETQYPWFHHLPVYLKYAPGFKAAYKCEQYRKYVCDDERDKCSIAELVNETNHEFLYKNKPAEFPHMAQIGIIVPNIIRFYCGGAIVSPRWIMSAYTECVSHRGIEANVALIGDYLTPEVRDYPGWEYVYQIDKVLKYPFSTRGDQREGSESVDLGLYRTIKDIRFSNRVRPACLYYRPLGTIYSDPISKKGADEGVFTGFGLTEVDGKNGNRTDTMKKVFMYLRKDKCMGANVTEQEAKNVFCTEARSPVHGVCKYDTGGPFVAGLLSPYCSWQLMGILTKGHSSCLQTDPLVFTNVTSLIAKLEDFLWPFMLLDVDNIASKCLRWNGRSLDMFFNQVQDIK